jgi:hypothetical protein
MSSNNFLIAVKGAKVHKMLEKSQNCDFLDEWLTGQKSKPVLVELIG